MSKILPRTLHHQSHATLLLDFDGTLAPIVRRPHQAKISPRLKKRVRQLSRHPRWTVGVVSGRDLKTVKKKMGLSGLIYAGNHGYEILMKGKLLIHPAAQKTKPLIHHLCKTLKKELKAIPGALIENKIYTASLHTRTLSRVSEKKATDIFYSSVRPHVKKKRLRITKGKKVLEIRPPADWNKGKAVQFILKKIKNPGFPIYIGDDTTDEDAFKALKKKGLGVRVGRGKTQAHVSIANIRQMPALLKQLETSIVIPAKETVS